MDKPPAATFNGFQMRDFAELYAAAAADVAPRFEARVASMLAAINRLPVCREVLLPEIQQRHAVRTAFNANRNGVWGEAGHWYTFHRGGRWEPQFNIGMYAAGVSFGN